MMVVRSRGLDGAGAREAAMSSFAVSVGVAGTASTARWRALLAGVFVVGAVVVEAVDSGSVGAGFPPPSVTERLVGTRGRVGGTMTP